MMTKTFILTAVLLSLIFIKSQSLKVEYAVQFKNQKPPNFGSEDFRKRAEKQQNEKQKHILSYLDGNLVYESFPAPPIYDTVNKPKRIYLTEVPLNTFSTPKIKVIKRKDNPTYYSLTKIKGEEFYQSGIPDDKILEIIDSKEKVLGYNCKIATVENQSKINTKVWYTEQIKIKTGPFTYYNFPGLVLKVETDYLSIEAKSVEKDAKNVTVEDIDKNLKVYNQEEFKEKLKQL